MPNGVAGRDQVPISDKEKDKVALDELRAALPPPTSGAVFSVEESGASSPMTQACIAFAIMQDPPLHNAPDARGPGKLKAKERTAFQHVCSPPKAETKAERLRNLATLAQAGVHGADAALLQEGPPVGVNEQEWKRELEARLQAHAVLGDTESIAALAHNYSVASSLLGKNPVLALRYEYANALIFNRVAATAGQALPAFSVEVLKNAKAAGVSEQQRDAAIAAAEAMAANARTRRYQ
ncbi:hypothetical protein RugamoR64_47370 [Duganella rhizosphaerae]|uniref:hypothetical protein n=1 Tax=Duganella rhizosphaerae TaxID=2885763 RepID=UPI0030EABEDF